MNEAERFSSVLEAAFSPYAALSPEVITELWRHYELLTRWNKSLNLTSIRNTEEAVLRHYCESLFVGIHLAPGAVSVLDVGSGGGFPGIPMAVLRPDCSFTLAESHQRKAVFLREATRHLGNVRVSPRRAEQADGRFDWAVSRAVPWREVLRVAEGFGSAVGLLLGRDDAVEAVREPAFEWEDPAPLPWGVRRVLALGRPLA